jgi:hypothetical protein
MNRARWTFVGVLALVTGVLPALLARPASADRPFDLRSLHGIYIGGLVEVRLPPVGTEPLEYCDTSGTLAFDGMGSGTSSLTRRCSITGTVTDVLTFMYSVAPDGSAEILFSSGEGGRFRLAQGGQLAFISAVGDFDASVLVHNGVFARR